MSSTSDEVGHTAHYFAAQHGFERRPDILRKSSQRRAAPEFVASFRYYKDRDEFLRRYNSHDSLVKALEKAVNDIRGGALDPDDFPWMQEAVAALSQAKGGK